MTETHRIYTERFVGRVRCIEVTDPGITQRYTGEILGSVRGVSEEIPGISQGYPRDIPGLSQGYSRDILRIPR